MKKNKAKVINIGDLVRRKYYNNSIQEKEIGFVVEIERPEWNDKIGVTWCFVEWLNSYDVADIRGYAYQDLEKVSK